MRITGGKLRSRVVSVPNLEIPGFRPTTDFLREVMFSSLQSYFSIEDKKVLDLFAGTGIVAFECLSRGARKAIAVESNKKLCDYITENSKTFLLEDQVVVVCEKVEKFQNTGEGFDFIFADAPYDALDFLSFSQSLFDKDLFSTESVYVYEDRAKNIQRLVDNQEYTKLPQLSLMKSKTFGDAGILIFKVFDE